MMDLTRIAHAKFRTVDTSARVVDQLELRSQSADKVTFVRFIQFGGGLVKVIVDSEDADVIKAAEEIMSSYNATLAPGWQRRPEDRSSEHYRAWDVKGK